MPLLNPTLPSPEWAISMGPNSELSFAFPQFAIATEICLSEGQYGSRSVVYEMRSLHILQLVASIGIIHVPSLKIYVIATPSRVNPYCSWPMLEGFL